MVGPAVTVRCPACGTPLRALLAPSPPTQWFPCSHCGAPVPVVVPRDPPPLYTWEVLPGLYPALPPPRLPKWRVRRVAAGALVGVAVVALVLAALFTYNAALAPAPGSFDSSGTVDLEQHGGGAQPSAGVSVVVTTETGAKYATVTAVGGTFLLTGLPTGGLTIVFSEAGYSPISVDAFVSTLYSAGATGLTVTLSFGSAGNTSTYSLTPFSDLEQFVAAIGAGVALLVLVGALAMYTAVVTLRVDRPPLGVVGGAAGMFSPLALLLLSLGSAFPLLVLVSAALALLGGFVVALRAVQMAQTGPAAL
jgi:hypothetical protein